MSRKEETVYPNEVLAAIAFAKKQDPKDKFGDKAFQLEGKPREGANGTSWLSFKVLKKVGEKMVYIPLKMKVTNLKTTGNIKTDEEKKEKKQDYPGINLMYNGESTFVRKVPGKPDVIENYGAAKIAISKAFVRLITIAMAEDNPNKIFVENKNVKTNVQLFRWTDKKRGEKENLEKPIIRVKIPFEAVNNVISKTAVPKIAVYDAEKPRTPDANGKIVGIPFMHAVDADNAPYNYTTIRQFIRAGSATSFIEDLSGVCLSSQGPSNPAKLDSFLIVKKGNGNRLQADEVYDQDEFAAMAGAETGGAAVDEEDNETPEKVVTAGADEFDDMDAAMEAEPEPEPAPAPVAKAPAKKPSAVATKKPAPKKVVEDEDLDDLDDE